MTITIPTVAELKREDHGDEKRSEHKHPIDDPAIQVVIAVCCAVVLSGIIFACILCIRRRHSASRRKSSLGHFFIGNDVPAPFGIASLNSQLYRSCSENNKDDSDIRNYNTIAYCDEYPQEDLSEFELSDRSSTPSGSDIVENSGNTGDSPRNEKSSQNLSKLTAVKKLKMMRRAKSLGNLSTSLASGIVSRFETETTLTLCLEYHEDNDVLNIDLQNVIDVPPRSHFSEVFITAHLFPVTNDCAYSKAVPADSIVHFDEILQFSNVSLKDLENCTLRLSLFSKKKTKPKALIGEAFVHGSEIDLKSASPTKLEVILQRKRLKKHSTADKHLNRNLGEVFILLQYNSMANRMKVFIRRAEHLPKSDKLLGQPVHYIIINIYKDFELLMTKETKTQSGYNPVWNQPFLFDIPSADVNDYVVELLVMRGRLHTKDGVIGRIVIGKPGTRSGCTHWEEMIRPCSHEVAKWHNILPVFRFE